MSILESIQKSELAAEEMKRKAMEEVDLLLENNKQEIADKVKTMYVASEEKRLQIEANTQIVITNKQNEIETLNKANKLALKELAYGRLKTVVDDVMKKVLQP